MVQVAITVPIKWSVEIKTEELRDALLSQKRLEPWVLIIGAEHAEYLEYGTGPAQNREGSYVSRWNDDLTPKSEMQYYKEVYAQSPFYRALVDWVRRKAFPSETKKKQYQIAFRIYQKICREGLRARPFFRPAFYYMCDHTQEWFERGYSIEDCITEMERMLHQLIKNNPLAPKGAEFMPNLGTLEESISIRALTPEEAESAKNPPIYPRPISDDMWEDKSREVASRL